MSLLWAGGAIVGGAALVVGVMFALGARLPVEHVSSRELIVDAPPERVQSLVSDVARAPEWRSGVTKVEVRDANHFTEVSGFGPMAMEVLEDSPARRVTRIADESQGFGGTWTFDFEPHGTSTKVKITERGTVKNPLFRFLSKHVFGHHKTIEVYLADLREAAGGLR